MYNVIAFVCVIFLLRILFSFLRDFFVIYNVIYNVLRKYSGYMGNSPPCLTVWFDKIFAKKMNVPKFQMVNSTEVGNNLVLGYAHHLLKMYICTCLTMIYGYYFHPWYASVALKGVTHCSKKVVAVVAGVVFYLMVKCSKRY